MASNFIGAKEISTDKNDMKEVDVTHIELEMFVWYIENLLKAKKVQLSHNPDPTDNANGRCTTKRPFLTSVQRTKP